MTETTRTTPEPTLDTPAGGPGDFVASEGLRALLVRLHEAGPGAWKNDPEAAALMGYAATKYAPLARKHGLDPWEAASAAFDAMRSASARTAVDPWALVTRAVQVTCIAEERAQGLLCSTHQARRPHISVFHDPERFSDRENPLTDYHPAFHTGDVTAADAVGHDHDEAANSTGAAGQAGMSATAAVEDAIALFAVLDWPPDVARSAIEHVCGALTRAGTRQSAFESLRRDKHARVLLDVPRASWTTLLRVLLGNPHPAYATTSTGRGVLLRLLIGERLPVLLRDDDLILTICLAAPHPRHRIVRGGR